MTDAPTIDIPTQIAAANGMTVDWSRWMQLSSREQDAIVRRYREIVKQESMAANWKRMDDAIRSVRV